MSAAIKRYRVILDGLVQGVGMRYFCKTTADHLDLSGSVRNRHDGKVEIHVQGDQESIDSFLNTIKKGNGFSQVWSMDIQEEPVEQHEYSFTYEW